VPGIKRYKVHWTSIALTDMREIIQHVSEDDVGKADALLDRLDRVAESLETLPFRGRIVPELAKTGKRGYREIIMAPWRIIYQIRGDDVYLSAVLDGRRNLNEILCERLGQ
jgi:toxin ParE1/3/4